MTEQAIPHPNGVTVFGSAQTRVAPDLASVVATISRIDPAPAAAFAAAREVARAATTFLTREQDIAALDVGLAQAVLVTAWKSSGGERTFLGYQARIGLNVIVRDLSRLESVLTGLVGAGVDALDRVELHTRHIAQIRRESRVRAVKAARSKAELYAEAAGVRLGAVLHIEDRNPNELRREYGAHGGSAPPDDAETEWTGAIPPGSVDVSAAVSVTFALLP